MELIKKMHRKTGCFVIKTAGFSPFLLIFPAYSRAAAQEVKLFRSPLRLSAMATSTMAIKGSSVSGSLPEVLLP